MKRFLFLFALLVSCVAGLSATTTIGDSITVGTATASTSVSSTGHFVQTNTATGANVLIGTNGHWRFVDPYGTTNEFYTNYWRLTFTNGQYIYATNTGAGSGDLVVSGKFRGDGSALTGLSNTSGLTNANLVNGTNLPITGLQNSGVFTTNNATQLSSGTVADARLSGNVALLNQSIAFLSSVTTSNLVATNNLNGALVVGTNTDEAVNILLISTRFLARALGLNTNGTLTLMGGLNVSGAGGVNFTGSGADLSMGNRQISGSGWTLNKDTGLQMSSSMPIKSSAAANFTTVTATNNFISIATNTLIFTTVSALTNTLGYDATASVSAGTSVAIQDRNGNAVDTIGTIATLHVLVPLRANWRLTGTGISATLY